MGLILGIKEVTQSFERTENYELNEGDHKNIVVFNTSDDVVCTIPGGLRVGFGCTIVQKGAGKVSFITPAAATLEDAKVNGGYSTIKTRGSWSWAKVLCIKENEYSVDFGGTSNGSLPPAYPDSDTRLDNPHIEGGYLYFDLLNVATGAVIPNYERTPLSTGGMSGQVKYINQSYTLLPEDAGCVLIFGNNIGRGVFTYDPLTCYVPDGLPESFACTIVPKLVPALSIEPAAGANIIIHNINGAFSTNVQCQQIILQSIGFTGDFGTKEYDLSFVEQVSSSTPDPPPLLPYRIYSALLTQSGTGNPVAEVLENTLGEELNWVRGGFAGMFTADVSYANRFITGKTTPCEGVCKVFAGTPKFFYGDAITQTTFQLLTYSGLAFSGFSDNCLYKTRIDIKVYR